MKRVGRKPGRADHGSIKGRRVDSETDGGKVFIHEGVDHVHRIRHAP